MRSPVLAFGIVVVLSMWLGAMLITSAVVAPAAFAVLPSRTLAGALVGRVLPVLFIAAIAIGAATVVASHRVNPSAVVASVVMIAASAIAQFMISPRIERIRTAVGGPIDALGVTDPRRMDFGRLHGISVLLLGLAGLGAVIALVTTARIIIRAKAA